MSLVTTCPACGTAFRVTPEQLSAHRGDVRCGHCQHIFSALQHLTEVAPPSFAPVPSAPPGPLPAGAESDVSAREQSTMPFQLLETAQPADPGVEAALMDTQAETELQEVAELQPGTETLDFEVESPEAATPAQEDVPFTEEIVITDSTSWAEPVVEPQAITAEPVPTQEAAGETTGKVNAEPESQPRVKKEDKPKRHLPNWLFALLTFLLILTALGQSVYFLRDGIASHYPQTKPLLTDLCKPLHCTVELPHQADLLSIEDSDLQDDPEHEGVLVLVTTLYNRAPYAQAYPLLELTLTDTLDKPVLRRTLTPQEYAPHNAALAQGLAAGEEINVRLDLSVGGAKPAGYRLYVKY